MNSLAAGVWAGFVATVYLSLFMLAQAKLGLAPKLNPIRDISAVAGKVAGARLPAPAGWLGHFVVGSLVWGVAYSMFQPALPGEPWVKGIIFGAFAWLAMMVAFMPVADEGQLGRKIGVSGVVVSLVLHILYGAILGLAYAY